MKEINILCKENFGWKHYKNDVSELWYNGIIYNSSFQNLAKNLCDKSQVEIKEFLINLDGNFSFIYSDKKKICASVDKISSIPIFYFIFRDQVYLSSNAYLLDNFIDFKHVNKDSVLAISMSGYSVGNETLYNNLKKLNCGEFLFFDKSVKDIKLINYYNYIPLNLELDDTEENYKKKYLDITFKIFKKLHNYSIQEDKKIAISMSAGLDTRLIVSTLKELGAKNIIGFSYGLKNNSEAKAAKKLCDYLGIPWKFSEFSNKKLKKIIYSESFVKFRKLTDTYYSTSDYSDYFAIAELFNNNFLKNSIIVNGHSGDFIAGGHMLNEFYKNDYSNDYLKNISRAIIKKHFRLWQNLATKSNDQIIEKLLIERIKNLNVNIENENQVFGIIESIQLQERQSKHCLSRQRNYENFGLSWALPLWDDQYLDFWEKIPFSLKLNRKFYKDVLIDRNISNVWKGNEWINLNSNIKINPWFFSYLRTFIKIFFIFSKKKWKLFDKKYFFYLIDNFCGFAPINYFKVIKDKREFRGSLSWVTDLYIKNKKLPQKFD